MLVYLDVVVLMNFLVDFLLLLGANRLSGYPPGIMKCCISSAFGGIYAGVCMLPGCYFLSNTLWRLVALVFMAILAFGFNRSAIRRGVLFVFLSMALGGISVGLNGNSFISLLLAAVGVVILCIIGFRGRVSGQRFVPVELTLKGKRYNITAMMDTGNTLKDPVTGQQVLVVGADIAMRIMGLTAQQLLDPIGTAAAGEIPGARLIPYRAVGQSCGMLLAYPFDEIKVNGDMAGKLVAFAPDKIGSDGAYQALVGGML